MDYIIFFFLKTFIRIILPRRDTIPKSTQVQYRQQLMLPDSSTN